MVLTGQISSGTRESLENHRKENTTSSKAPDDQIFIIESIQEMREVKNKGSKKRVTEFRVKWSGFPEDAATWEPEDNIPKFIQMFYNRHTGCNTRKSRDKRARRHTVGLFVAVKPCGTVVLVDELFGCEDIPQVYGILCDFFHNLSDMSSVKILLYDDNCHLGVYAENHELASLNPVTEHMAKMGKYIDKFHFRPELENYSWQNLFGFFNHVLCPIFFIKISHVSPNLENTSYIFKSRRQNIMLGWV